MKIVVFTEYDYPTATRDGVRGTHGEWCVKEVKRLAGHGMRAEVVPEKNGRLNNGVARVAVGRVYE